MGCCSTKPQTIENDQFGFAPQSNGPYQLDYIPSTNKNIYPSVPYDPSVVSRYDQPVFVSPLQSQHNTGNLQYFDETDKRTELNAHALNGSIGNVNFRQSIVPMPNTAAVMVEIKDLQTLQRF